MARITRCARLNFNPRSSCEERLKVSLIQLVFTHFNPRSSCEERPQVHGWGLYFAAFQSTLLMRGATSAAQVYCSVL